MDEYVVATIIDCAEEVFDELGSGLSEANYHNAMDVELNVKGIPYQSKSVIGLEYRGLQVGYKEIDTVVYGKNSDVIVEYKQSKDPEKVKSQIGTYIDVYEDQVRSVEWGLVICFNDGVEWELIR